MEETKRWNLTRSQLLAMEAAVFMIGMVMIFVLAVVFKFINDKPLTKPEFGLNSLSVSDFNISGSQITAIWEVSFFSTKASTKCSRYYNNAVVSVFYGNRLLSEAPAPRINVSKETQSFIIYVNALAKRIEDPRVADDIARDWSVSGVAAFTVKLLGASFVNRNNYYVVSKSNVLNVTCPDIKVGFSNRSSSHGTMVVQHSPNITGDEEAISRCSTWLDYY